VEFPLTNGAIWEIATKTSCEALQDLRPSQLTVNCKETEQRGVLNPDMIKQAVTICRYCSMWREGYSVQLTHSPKHQPNSQSLSLQWRSAHVFVVSKQPSRTVPTCCQSRASFLLLLIWKRFQQPFGGFGKSSTSASVNRTSLPFSLPDPETLVGYGSKITGSLPSDAHTEEHLRSPILKTVKSTFWASWYLWAPTHVSMGEWLIGKCWTSQMHRMAKIIRK